MLSYLSYYFTAVPPRLTDEQESAILHWTAECKLVSVTPPITFAIPLRTRLMFEIQKGTALKECKDNHLGESLAMWVLLEWIHTYRPDTEAEEFLCSKCQCKKSYKTALMQSS